LLVICLIMLVIDWYVLFRIVGYLMLVILFSYYMCLVASYVFIIVCY